MFSLTIWERLAILAGSAGVICFVIILTICFVCPCCCIYKRMQYRNPVETLLYKKKKYTAASPIVAMPSYRENKPACSEPLAYTDPPPSYETSVFHHPMELVKLNSTASNSSETGIPIPQMNGMDSGFVDNPDSANQICGTVTFSLKYRPKENLDETGTLQIMPKEANDLPLRPYGPRCDIFLVLQINKLPKRKHHIGKNQREFPLCQFETAIRRKCQNPMFDENFAFHVNEKDIAKCGIKIIVWDKEKLVNDTALGEAHVNLKEVFDAKKESAEEYILKLHLKEPKLNYGEILLGLCYLPTAERLTVAILKVNNLKQELQNGNAELVTFVQAMAIYGGKVTEKRKTSSRPHSIFPIFNEMLMFDIPTSKLESIVLMISVRNKISSQHIINNHENTHKNDACIGKVLLGSCCKKSGFQHWNAMRNSPRKQVVQWHVLR